MVHLTRNNFCCCRFGIDQTTVSGFFVQSLFLIHGCFSYNLVMTLATTFFVSSCYYLRACCAEIGETFKAIDQMLSNGNERKLVAAEVERRIQYIVMFHIKITE